MFKICFILIDSSFNGIVYCSFLSFNRNWKDVNWAEKQKWWSHQGEHKAEDWATRWDFHTSVVDWRFLDLVFLLVHKSTESNRSVHIRFLWCNKRTTYQYDCSNSCLCFSQSSGIHIHYVNKSWETKCQFWWSLWIISLKKEQSVLMTGSTSMDHVTTSPLMRRTGLRAEMPVWLWEDTWSSLPVNKNGYDILFP